MEELLREEISNINLNKVNNILNKISAEELLNYRFFPHYKSINDNKYPVMEYVMCCLRGNNRIQEGEILQLKHFECDDFDERTRYTFMNKLKTNKKLKDVLNLIDMILKKQPKCLTIKMYNSVVNLQHIKILDIFKKYYIHDEPVENYCYVCNSEHQLHLLESTCHCKSVFVHLYCLIELINEGYDECTICKKEYNPHIYKERYSLCVLFTFI